MTLFFFFNSRVSVLHWPVVWVPLPAYRSCQMFRFILPALAFHCVCKQGLTTISRWWLSSLQLDTAHWLPLTSFAGWDTLKPFLHYSGWVRERPRVGSFWFPAYISSLLTTLCIAQLLCSLNPFLVRTTAFIRKEWNISLVSPSCCVLSPQSAFFFVSWDVHFIIITHSVYGTLSLQR